MQLTRQQGQSAEQMVARRPYIDFAPEVPRDWYGGSRLGSLFLNALQLLFPEGERFFVRSAAPFIRGGADPQRARAVEAFAAQEARHSMLHRRFNAVLERQGYRIDGFLDLFARHLRWVEQRCSDKLRLSITASAEHLTASLAAALITCPDMQKAPLPMRQLWMWHCAEEIEHKSVIYDILQSVDRSWTLRFAGFLVGVSLVVGYCSIGLVSLFARDPQYRSWHLCIDLVRALFRNRQVHAVLKSVLFDYLRPGFHPEQLDNRRLIQIGLSHAELTPDLGGDAATEYAS